MIQSFDEMCVQTAKLIPVDRPVHLLDLGCCTELEYDAFIRVNPDIEVTGIEEEERLKTMLEKKSGKRIQRLRLIYGNYFNIDLGKRRYDMAMSVMEMNDYDRKTRLLLYKKVYDALETDGIYIERDYVRDAEHIVGNITNMFSSQISLLLESGFQRVEKAWYNRNTIILKAMK